MPSDSSSPSVIAKVLPAAPLSEAYDYLIPASISVKEGDYVEIPLGRRQICGVVWYLSPQSTVSAHKLKPLTKRFDLPPLPQVLRQFVDWVAAYTLSPSGMVLRMTMSVPQALEPPRSLLFYERAPHPLPASFRLTPPRQRVLEILEKTPSAESSALAKEARCSSAVLKAMASAGVLISRHQEPVQQTTAVDGERSGPTLSPAQQDAVHVLRARVEARVFSATLLDGVTGSGKTEVYLETIAACLHQGRQILVLLPEISLSPQVLDRFAKRFGVTPAVWHSDLSDSQRQRTWRDVAKGTAQVIVGARSALFLPFPDLGLIVVDEEHDPSFKQEEGVIYQARDMAVVRARLGQIPIVLVSATPSLETVVNVEAGRYTRVHLPSRHGVAVLPEIQLLDLRKDKPPPKHWLAPPLVSAITETLDNKEQTLLFLNRRGYAPLTLCRSCGHRLQCPHCTAWLVEHRQTGRLHCHHCGYATALPSHCPQCQAEKNFAACGPGIERITEEAKALFPKAHIVQMASDTVTNSQALNALIEDIRQRRIDIVIGTQMVAKGHHFPHLTLVGVVDADMGLAGGDLRATERTYQLLHQVAGRAGRADKPGRVFLQTYQPEHPVMQALLRNDREAFLAQEAEERRRHEMPPFGRLAALIVSGPDLATVTQIARKLGQTAPRSDSVIILGPAPAPLAILRGRHRQRLLLKAPRSTSLQPLITHWLEQVRLPSNVRVQVDIDPYSFL